MQTIQIYFLIIIILIIVLSSLIAKNQDNQIYHDVYHMKKNLEHTNKLIRNNNIHEYRLFDVKDIDQSLLEYFHNKQEFVKDYCLKWDSQLNQLYEEIDEVHQKYALMPEEKPVGEWIFLTNEQASNHEIKKLIKDNAKTLVHDYNIFQNDLKRLFQDTTHISYWDFSFFKQWETLNNKTLDTVSVLLDYFNDEKRLLFFTQDFDIIHLKLFLTACQQEIQQMNFELYKNISVLFDRIDLRFLKPYEFTITSHAEQAPKVGQPFKMYLNAIPFVPSDDLIIHVNGKPVAVKNGIGSYNVQYPVQSNEIHTSISLKNPKTGKINNISKRTNHLQSIMH